MKIGFDNEKYLALQAEHIRERIAQFGGIQTIMRVRLIVTF